MLRRSAAAVGNVALLPMQRSHILAKPWAQLIETGEVSEDGIFNTQAPAIAIDGSGLLAVTKVSAQTMP